jgi:hypothetical protein
MTYTHVNAVAIECVGVSIFYGYPPVTLRELKYVFSSVPLPRTVYLNAT